jgi:hypothetical protein
LRVLATLSFSVASGERRFLTQGRDVDAREPPLEG